MLAAVIILSIATASLAAACIVMYRRLRRLGSRHDNTVDDAKNLRHVLRQLIDLHYTTIKADDDTFLRALRRLKAHQGAEAIKVLENKQDSKRRASEFCIAFDKALFTFQPDLYQRINRHFLHDKQFTAPAPQTLSNEVRILMLASLGITDAEIVGALLGLTPASVYTYRNRTRTRAINRENFNKFIDGLGHDDKSILSF